MCTQRECLWAAWDDDVLHLALTSSPIVAGLARFSASVGLLVIGVAFVSNPLWSTHLSVKAMLLGGVALAAALTLASLPFAMQWQAGQLPDGQRGLSIERVRWFFLRDARDVPAHEIASLNVDGDWLVVTLETGERISLTRIGRSNILTDWYQDRTLMCLLRVIRTDTAAVKVVRKD